MISPPQACSEDAQAAATALTLLECAGVIPPPASLRALAHALTLPLPLPLTRPLPLPFPLPLTLPLPHTLPLNLPLPPSSSLPRSFRQTAQSFFGMELAALVPITPTVKEEPLPSKAVTEAVTNLAPEAAAGRDAPANEKSRDESRYESANGKRSPGRTARGEMAPTISMAPTAAPRRALPLFVLARALSALASFGPEAGSSGPDAGLSLEPLLHTALSRLRAAGGGASNEEGWAEDVEEVGERGPGDVAAELLWVMSLLFEGARVRGGSTEGRGEEVTSPRV